MKWTVCSVYWNTQLCLFSSLAQCYCVVHRGDEGDEGSLWAKEPQGSGHIQIKWIICSTYKLCCWNRCRTVHNLNNLSNILKQQEQHGILHPSCKRHWYPHWIYWNDFPFFGGHFSFWLALSVSVWTPFSWVNKWPYLTMPSVHYDKCIPQLESVCVLPHIQCARQPGANIWLANNNNIIIIIIILLFDLFNNNKANTDAFNGGL